MNPTFKQVTKTRYVELVAELAQEIFVQHYTKLTPKVAAALADIRRQGLKVVPQCSFVAVYIKRHPEWSDMVSETAGAER